MPTSHPSPYLARTPWLVVAALAVWASPVVAQEQSALSVQTLAQQWAGDAVLKSQRPGGSPLRMEVQVGALDSRVRLAACGNMEVYVPPGSRLWGRSRVGVKCVDGMSRWNITLPVTVRAWGDAWVVKNQLAVGVNVNDSDIIRGEVDWAEEPAAVLTERSAWLGQTASRVLTTGQALRQGMLRPAQVFQAGASVKIVAQGPGFQISSEAQALSAGVIGQQARVKMDNGRVATGTVLDVRTVKIDL